MTSEAPQWDHGERSIDGKTVFLIETNGKISKLHLISFPNEVEEEQILEVYKQRNLRGVTQDEWRVFLTTTPKQAFKSTDFEIALMYTGKRDNSEAQFPETIVYNPRTREMEMISNWTQRFWGPDIAFLFAEK